jgi:cardiolipin synthase A/B
VWLTSAYFVPDEPTLAALKTASLRGVDVRVLVPRVGDSWVVSAATRSYYDELTDCGVKLYEYLPTMHHAKTMVVDEDLAIVGSANFDARSFRLNFELMMVIYGTAAARALAEMFEKDLADSERVTGREPRSLRPWERVTEAAARVLSPIL